MKKKILGLFLVMLLVFSFVGCTADDIDTTSPSSNKVNLLLSGWTNTPTTSSDPFKAYIKENYDLDVQLNASSDFDNACLAAFNSINDKPDIVSFPDYTTFLKYKKQGILLEDWTPYLQYMPNFSKMINLDSQAFTKQILTKENKLTTLWTPSDPAEWSLKLREDWLKEFRTQTSKAVDWAPQVPNDLLEFARWIKTAKNSDQNNLDVFAFTSAGGSESLGQLGTWLPLMFGVVSIPPWGIYVKDGNVEFATTDGSYQKMLEFLRIIVQEKLIEPKWYSQTFDDKARTYKGKIGIEWLPSSISEYTQNEFSDKQGNYLQDTIDWWETYSLPVDSSADKTIAGFMPGAGLVGRVITVSKKVSLDTQKMIKIAKFIDDCYAYYDEDTDTYLRGDAYDALRWGLGIENGLAFEDIEETNLKYINTSSKTAGKTSYYREDNPGAWDWGAWFSVTNDGIIQGSNKEVNAMVIKSAEHSIKTAQMPSLPQVGAYLELNATDISEMQSQMVAFEYRYVTENWNDSKRNEEYSKFLNTWKGTLKGNEILEQAKQQFKDLGLI